VRAGIGIQFKDVARPSRGGKIETAHWPATLIGDKRNEYTCEAQYAVFDKVIFIF